MTFFNGPSNLGSSGGGGGGVTRTTLWFNDWSTTNADITLSDDFRNYDYIEVVLMRSVSSNTRQLYTNWYSSDTLNTAYEQQLFREIVFTALNSMYIVYNFESPTQMHYGTQSGGIYLGKIVGVKFG